MAVTMNIRVSWFMLLVGLFMLAAFVCASRVDAARLSDNSLASPEHRIICGDCRPVHLIAAPRD